MTTTTTETGTEPAAEAGTAAEGGRNDTLNQEAFGLGRLSPELHPGSGNQLFVFALP